MACLNTFCSRSMDDWDDEPTETPVKKRVKEESGILSSEKDKSKVVKREVNSGVKRVVKLEAKCEATTKSFEISGDPASVHKDNCKVKDCPRCFLLTMKSSWEPRLPLNDQAPTGENWLCEAIDEHGNGDGPLWIGFGCVACQSGSGRANSGFSSCSLRKPKLSVLVRHHKSREHLSNVRTYLKSDFGPSGKPTATAPPRERFIKLWNHIKTGSIRNGLSEVGGRGKCERTLFILFEATLAIDRTFLKTATCVGLQRDECKGHLVIRFRAANQDLKFRQGLLGKAKGFGSGAKAINAATKSALTEFCTPMNDCPKTIKQEKKNRCDEALFEHMRHSIEMMNTDAADDEMLASVLSRHEGHGIAGEDTEALLPNNRLTIKDKTHASRRCHVSLASQH